MDASAIEAVLAEGRIGEMPFSEFLEALGPVMDITDWEQLFRDREQVSKPLSVRLIELGVLAARWEPVEKEADEQRLWRACLVLTLSAAASSSLKIIHDIAVTLCMSFFYALKDQELWIEYQVASSESTTKMQEVLDAGKIGEMPFSMWLSYDYAREGASQIAASLGSVGVSSVKWEETESDRKYLGHVQWQSYVVATLPMSDFASPPSMPSGLLLYAVAGALRHPCKYLLKATDAGVQVWVPFTVKLPLDDRAVELLEKNGISTKRWRAEKTSFRNSLKTLRQALLATIRRK